MPCPRSTTRGRPRDSSNAVLGDLLLELDGVPRVPGGAALVHEEVVIGRLLGADTGRQRGQAGVGDRAWREAQVLPRVVRVALVVQLRVSELAVGQPQPVEDGHVRAERYV